MPSSALYGGPSLSIDWARGSWRWTSCLAYPPFAFELQLAASSYDGPNDLCDIGNFLGVGDNATATVELDLLVAFSHTPYTGDWRTRAQIDHGLDLYGRSVDGS